MNLTATKKLIEATTKREVKVGDVMTDFRLERVTVISMTEPHKASSTGRIGIRDEDGFEMEVFPSVVNAEWVPQ